LPRLSRTVTVNVTDPPATGIVFCVGVTSMKAGGLPDLLFAAESGFVASPAQDRATAHPITTNGRRHPPQNDLVIV
jgi:hypothetical protein